MKTRTLAMLALLLTGAGLAGGCILIDGRASVIGSGNLTSETRDIEPFTGLIVKGSADTKVTVGGAPSLEIEAEDNILPLITTEVSRGRLEIASKGCYRARKAVRVVVTTPSLEEVSLAGSGDIDIDNLEAETFRVELRGSGDIAGRGKARVVKVMLMGSGDIDLSGVQAEQAEVNLLGSGDVAVFAAARVVADIRGSGDVVYAGSPREVEKTIFGSGDVQPASR